MKIKECKNVRLHLPLSKLSDKDKLNLILKMYGALDALGMRSGNHVLKPGLDHIIVMDEPITISHKEAEWSADTTIGQLMEAIVTVFQENA